MQLKNDVQTISISMNTPNFSSRYLPVSRWWFQMNRKKKPGCLGGFMQGMVHTGAQLCGDYTKPLLGDGNSKIFWNLDVFWVLFFFFACVLNSLGPQAQLFYGFCLNRIKDAWKEWKLFWSPKKTQYLNHGSFIWNPRFSYEKTHGFNVCHGNVVWTFLNSGELLDQLKVTLPTHSDLLRCLIDEDDNGKVTQSDFSRWWSQISFHFHPYLGKIPNLTHIFQMGWNHRLVFVTVNKLHVVDFVV